MRELSSSALIRTGYWLLMEQRVGGGCNTSGFPAVVSINDVWLSHDRTRLVFIEPENEKANLRFFVVTHVHSFY